MIIWIMWEFTFGTLPFNDKAHNFQLCLSICKVECPKIIENTPQCYINLMKKCWEIDPLKRPNASEVCKIIKSWYDIIIIAIEFWKAEEKQTGIFKKINNNSVIKSHPQVYHTSRLLNFTIILNEILKEENSECLDCSINN